MKRLIFSLVFLTLNALCHARQMHIKVCMPPMNPKNPGMVNRKPEIMQWKSSAYNDLHVQVKAHHYLHGDRTTAMEIKVYSVIEGREIIVCSPVMLVTESGEPKYVQIKNKTTDTTLESIKVTCRCSSESSIGVEFTE